ncbi:thiamine-phosphate kinase [Venenivibrio stagnispumantis]|uniref:Thiamine-monophosphate kinase n=1 Tax=Venenivibrio stagnispumantis TaxID=407998 RepID=A0AA45WKG6_9AQUI|nr:thiamine-phosphate kinase [Venenivibrio stagnispumantis]MCW4573492.1 thiamine-phosphate kinase [Venenivibrio stagnispumantis]SMP06643.1 thiamine-monophosphate kinase [Venenivibrio stagnispumantis]
MKIGDIGEFGLIDRLSSIIKTDDKDVIVGIGDDTACVNINGKLILFTVDIQVENTHFIKDKINPEYLGWKLATTNVSDIVACGGVPRWSLISFTASKDTDLSFIEAVYKGIKEAIDYYKFSVIGGNISSSDKLAFDMFFVGETERFVGRDTAKVGDFVYLSAPVGLSRAGLELILNKQDIKEDFEEKLILNHYKPVARIDLKDTILKYANSCIDISDGLVQDLYHISEKSNVKIVLQKDKLPIDQSLLEFCNKYNKDIYDYILYGGEDYQIVLTSDKELNNMLKIGYIEEGSGVYLDNTKLPKKGFNHF